MKKILIFLWIFNSVLVTASEGFPPMLDGDTRQLQSSSSPVWLGAVGRTFTEKRNYSDQKKVRKAEQCSLALVVDQPNKDGIIVVGAGHCIDHWVSGSNKTSPYIKELKAAKNTSWTADQVHAWNIEPHTITFRTNTGQTVKRTLVDIFHAETHRGDYFVGKLDRYVPRSIITPLLNSPYDYTDMMDFPFKTTAYAAGYSADTGIGQRGKVLTYDACERLNGGASGMKKAYCHSYPGASGGPFVIEIDFALTGSIHNPDCYSCKEYEEFDGDTFDDFFAEEFEPHLQRKQHGFFIGTIVGGRQGDDNSRTLFTETTHYSRLLDAILRDH